MKPTLGQVQTLNLATNVIASLGALRGVHIDIHIGAASRIHLGEELIHTLSTYALLLKLA
ncbi:MAG: hypothetical protein R3C99_05090 [Pirellulaceae bacterium]